MQPMTQVAPVSNKRLWTGRIVSAIVVLFLLLDAAMKIAKLSAAAQGTIQLGYPESVVRGIGILLLVCTLLYAIPRTSILGAVLVTGYLGGRHRDQRARRRSALQPRPLPGLCRCAALGRPFLARSPSPPLHF